MSRNLYGVKEFRTPGEYNTRDELIKSFEDFINEDEIEPIETKYAAGQGYLSILVTYAVVPKDIEEAITKGVAEAMTKRGEPTGDSPKGKGKSKKDVDNGEEGVIVH